jgi:cytochrome b561
MPLRNGEHGYGAVTKTLHWLTFLLVVAQFAVGWTMDTEDDRERFDAQKEACEATADSDAAEAEEDRCEDRVKRAEDAVKDSGEDEDRPSDLHVALGVAILVLASLRVLWRRFTPLPPWSERYGKVGRTLQWALEKAMLTLLFVVPVSGLLLYRGDVALAVHVTAQIAFLVATGVHIVMQLGYRHLARMV